MTDLLRVETRRVCQKLAGQVIDDGTKAVQRAAAGRGRPKPSRARGQPG